MKFAAESALAKIRRQRKGEAKATEQYEVKDENAEIYETVTEEDYQKLKERRRAQHWVEGEGYSDDGEEWWESDSGGEESQDEGPEDGEEAEGSRRQAAVCGKRKKGSSGWQQENKNGGSAGAGKRPRRAGGPGGGPAGEGQPNAMRMRSLVQHFTARAAETAAVQQQQRLTQRDAESLRSLDRLLDEDEEEQAGTTARITGITAGDPETATQSKNSLSSRVGGPLDTFHRPSPHPEAANRISASGKQQRITSAAREEEFRRTAAAVSVDYFDSANDDLEPTQALDVGDSRTFNNEKISSRDSKKYSAYATSFLEQLGLGSSCGVVSEDSPCASGGAAAQTQKLGATETATASSSRRQDRAFVAAATVAPLKEAYEGAAAGDTDDAYDEMAAAGEGPLIEPEIASAASDAVDAVAAKDNGDALEEESGTHASGAEEVEEKEECLFQSTGEFEQHTKSGVSLLKHAQPDFFLWTKDEEEQEAAAATSATVARSTVEVKTDAAATVSSAGGGYVGPTSSLEGIKRMKRSSGGLSAETATSLSDVADVTDASSDRGCLRASGDKLPCCKDGSLPFYLLDAWEEEGLLFLFGKVWAAAAEAGDGGGSSSWKKAERMRHPPPESCCVIVKDMMVPLFFRTREQVVFEAEPSVGDVTGAGNRLSAASTHGQEKEANPTVETALPQQRQPPADCTSSCDGDSSGSATALLQEQQDEEETLRQRLKRRLDITRSFFLHDAQRLKKKYQWRKVAVKGVFRHYAFDAPGVPRERNQTFVKMYVPAATKGGSLLQPEDWEGQTYSHVFGIRPSLIELLLIKRQIKGPCWLRIRNFTCVASPLDKLSWCRYEVTVHSHKAVCCWDYTAETPATCTSSRRLSTAQEMTVAAGTPPTTNHSLGPSSSSAAADAERAAGDVTVPAAGSDTTSAVCGGNTFQALPPPRPPPLTVVSVCMRTLQLPLPGSSSSFAAASSGSRGGERTAAEKQLAIAAFFVYRNADVDDQTAAAPKLTPHTVFCAVRRMRLRGASAGISLSSGSGGGSSAAVQCSAARVLAEGVPLRFPEACAKQGFTLFDSERSLLLAFVNQIAAVDPDILIGHDVYSSTLDLLAQRLVAYGLPAWHRLSRLKRGKHQLKSLRSLFFQHRSHHSGEGLAAAGGSGFLWGGRMLTVGRLVCDTYLQSRELLSHRVDYDLLNLIQALFFPRGVVSSSSSGATTPSHEKNVKGQEQQRGCHQQVGDQQRLEAVLKGLRMFPQQQELLGCFHRREPQALLACLHLTLQEAYVTLLLCWRLNCLPLTKELTTIGGNLWNRSLQNQRAERNAFLLLHEFHREKYVCPDPPVSSSAAAAAIANRRRQLLHRRPAAPAGDTAKASSDSYQQRRRTPSVKEQSSHDGQKRLQGPGEEIRTARAAAAAANGSADPAAADEGEDEDEGEAIFLDAAALHEKDEEEEAVAGAGVPDDSAAGAESNGATASTSSYAGGLVLEPRVGYFETFVLLLDFNSLYPSIIQEFNVCFSTVKRAPVGIQSSGGGSRPDSAAAAAALNDNKAEGNVSSSGSGKTATEEGNELFGRSPVISDCGNSATRVQGVSSTPGILPRILRQLVQRRRAVKASMKTEGNPLRRAALEVKQLALKLTANSIYGCLGFSHSRFYARDLAAFITQQGRNVLLATKEKVERVLKLEVLYGDTDSLMINTGLRDDGGLGKAYAQAVRLGEQVKTEINRSYRRLEIDLEAVFHRLLLLRKKKYACCIVVDYAKQQYRLEQKGLDFVRRDWAKLTRVVGQQLLEILFAATPNRRRPALPSARCASLSHHAQQQQQGQLQQQGQRQQQGQQQEFRQQEREEEGEQREVRESRGRVSGEAEETVDAVVEKLHAKLEEVARQLREKKVPLEYFVITKALTKLPQMYPRGAGGAVMHPHVQVALRMQSRGVPIKPGSEIPFVICTAESAKAVLFAANGKETGAAGAAVATPEAGRAVVPGEAATPKSPTDSSKHGSSSSTPESSREASIGKTPDVHARETSEKTFDKRRNSVNDSVSQSSCSSTDNSSKKQNVVQSNNERQKTTSILSAAERAFHPREVLSNPVLQIDVDYYIEQQLLPPILRLCAHVQGTSGARLAECLGLEGSKHARSPAAVGGTRDDSDDDGRCSREARERAGEEQILALLARNDEKYKRHPLPIHLRCESCRVQIAGKDVLRYMRCPTCLWWISPSILSNFITFTLAALQRRYTKAIMRCTTCDEHYAGIPTPPAATPRSRGLAGAVWQQQQCRAAASGLVRCPRCEEGRLREDMSSYDMYVYLDQLLFYLSGDVTSQQRLLAEKFSTEEKQLDLVWKHLHNSSGNGRNSAAVTLTGSSPRRAGDDAWLVPAALDANLRVRILAEGRGKPRRQGTTAEDKGEDLLDELYTRVTQQDVLVKRGAQLRYPGLTAAVTYWQKSKRGLGWIDMQHERNKLRTTVNEVMEQNAYRMLKLSSLYNVMKPPSVLDPTKRRWRIVQKLNLLKQTEAARSGWNEELRCRAPAVLASLEIVTQNAHGGESSAQNAAFGGFPCFTAQN